jgi:hypothetical protein
MIFRSKNITESELQQVNLLNEIIVQYLVPEFTELVLVEEKVVPHSHPILTLNTRSKDKLDILKTLVHEQFHWYASNHPKYNECISLLKMRYIDDGEHNRSGRNPNSYWEHIIVCFNTRNYLERILTKEEVSYVYSLWQPYSTLEQSIAANYGEYKKFLESFEIIY